MFEPLDRPSDVSTVNRPGAVADAASKFYVEGFQESLALEVAPFGIKTMLVKPGFFRTELLTPNPPSTHPDRSRTTRHGTDRADRRRLAGHERPADR